MDDAEKLKMQSHVGILQNEYHRMMQRVDELERENDALKASAGVNDGNDFTSRILRSVADLYNNRKYSDINILLKGRTLFGHKFVLSARYPPWGSDENEEVNLEDLDLDIGEQIVKWIYTNRISLQKEPRILLGVMEAAFKFELQGLLGRCEEALIGLVDITNCIAFYVKAEEFQAEKLKLICYELISSHWTDFTEADFREMTPRLLLDIFKRKTKNPLHVAVRARRLDVVLLYLSETKGKWSELVNSFDEQGDCCLDLALRTGQTDLAASLVDSYAADVSLVSPHGRSLLLLAVERADEAAATFLLEHGARVDAVSPSPERETALHCACDWREDEAEREGNARVARLLLLRREIDPNAQDGRGDTPLHRAVRTGNAAARQALLAVPKQVDLDRRNQAGDCVLWLALEAASRHGPGQTEAECFALPAELLAKNASPDTVDPQTGDSLLQRCARTLDMLGPALFLVAHGADLDHANRRGETALHIACRRGLFALTKRLLEAGADPNAVTAGVRGRHKRDDSGISFAIQVNGVHLGGGQAPSQEVVGAGSSGNPFEMEEDEEEAPELAPDEAENGREEGSVSSMVEEEEASQRTPMHVAVAYKDAQMANCFLDRRCALQQTGDGILPDFTLRDSDDNSVFGLALWCELFDLAERMLTVGGCSVTEHNEEQLSLLHQAIQRQHTQAAIFLMEHGADLHEETPKDRLTPLELAIEHDCSAIAEALCRRGACINRFHPVTGECPLWRALVRGRQVIAQVLVEAGCDVDMWHWDGESEGTLLHKAMNMNEDTIVAFLVKNGCDVNAVRRPGPDGEGGEESRDGQTPLHIAASWNGVAMAEALLAREDLQINKQDVDGNTALHNALRNRDKDIVRLLLADQRTNVRLKNKRGSTSFHLAMGTGNEEAARTILRRDPSATEEMDKMGRNFLHIAIEKADMKSFFFLLTIEANVNTRVCGDQQYSPLHLAVLSGQESILRSLLLKGAQVNAEAIPKATALHLAASNNRAEMIGTLLEHGANIHARDDQGNNALHRALRHGHHESAKELLARQADAEATNIRGRTPLHELAAHSPERSTLCFEELLRQRPDLPLDAVEADGNSPLLIAYLQGNKRLCIALIKAGASLGCRNRHGQTIFNFKHPSNDLLPKLLDHVEQEPSWCDSEVCLECNTKFSLTTRRHHCRHCGRMLCAKCSADVVPILKFNMSKPERVCQICFDFLNCRM